MGTSRHRSVRNGWRAALVAGLAVVGCGHAGVAPSRPARGADTVDDARPLRFARGAGDTVVTDAVGAGGSAWYAFEVADGCVSVELRLRTTGGRARTRARLEVVDPRGERRLARRGRLRVFAAPLGHYHVRVAGAGDGDTTYQLTVHDATDGMECEGPEPPHALRVDPVAPEVLPAAPPDAVAVPIAAWETWSDPSDPPRVLARLGVGADDGFGDGDHGDAVYRTGTVLPGVTLIVTASDAHTSLAEVRGAAAPAAAIAGAWLRRHPPPPPPLTVDVVDRWRDDTAPVIAIRGGRWDGVAAGWRGTLLDRDRHPLGALEVIAVEPHRSRAAVRGATLAAVLAARTAVIAPP